MAPSFERPYAPGLACWFGWWVLRKVSEKVVGLCGQAILLGARGEMYGALILVGDERLLSAREIMMMANIDNPPLSRRTTETP